MVIWLRNPHIELSGSACSSADVGIGDEDGILRRESYAAIVALDEAGDACRLRHGEIVADAERRAKQIIASAEQQAQTLIEEAQQEYAQAQQRGYEAGTTQALGDWYARAAQHASEQHDMHERLRERMAELVVAAVEQVIRSEDSGALFARSATALDRIAQGCSWLKVRVHPDDYEAATQAFDRFSEEMRQRGRVAPVTVVGDRGLPCGACICESDMGMVDASLTTQLAAIRAAVERALAHEQAEEAI